MRSVLGVLALLATVTAQSVSVAQEVCWPQGFTPRPTIIGQSAPAPKAREPIHVYIDNSLSMIGFVAAPKPDPGAMQIYPILVQQLPNLADLLSGDLTVRTFGTSISKEPLTAAQMRAAIDRQNPGNFYTAIDTRINDPLQRALSEPSRTLSIVVTDLFMSDAEMLDDGFVALRGPLAKGLRDGRAIGIVGLRSAFNGNIYDIPGWEPAKFNQPAKTGYQLAKSRPLILLMVGPTDRVREFHRRLESEVLRDVRPQHKQFTLFTPDTSAGFTGANGWPKNGFTLPADAKDDLGFLDAILPGQKIRQIGVLRRTKDVPTGTLDIGPLWMPYTLPPTKIEVASQVWKLNRPNRGCARTWSEPVGGVEKGVQIVSSSDGSTKIGFRLFGDGGEEDIRRLLPSRAKYLLVADFAATKADLRGPAAWLEQPDWSFESTNAPALLARRPGVEFFPTLNLARVGRSMRDIVLETFKPAPVAQFVVGFELEAR